MRKHRLLLIMAISISIILTGCFQGEQSLEEMDPPQDAEAVDNDLTSSIQSEDSEGENEEVTESEETAEEKTVERELYLIDSNGMVASQTLELPIPESKEVATQVLEYLVKDGPVTQMLPNGFQAVLPADTEVLGLELEEDGTLIVDLSEEFTEYDAKEEIKILEAMTYTLTQFENVEQVKLWVNGHEQEVMPVNGTPIGDGYSRANGINVTESDNIDLINSKAVTMYFPAEHDDNQYFVPVTQHVKAENGDALQAIVDSLVDGPGYVTNLMHVFNAGAQLVETPNLQNGVLDLVFNENVLQDMDNSVISDEVMETLVRTLTEQQDVEAVNVRVENVEQLVNENGEAYSEPVTKETFLPSEKF
ncbi:spore gernimation protein [Ornithinibacillus sp. L9]|uniref:Spore gernimation protein n=1 Tax=Ornithinibacillus caprae TaxID=2678566 RepID=A0A6N8FFD5_9BACI|nr:GerMN domain-containing protein [Ornithinibacillus caprae]MUK86944.1 spore gernimation protein [Ornithinibacillus caprae]